MQGSHCFKNQPSFREHPSSDKPILFIEKKWGDMTHLQKTPQGKKVYSRRLFRDTDKCT